MIGTHILNMLFALITKATNLLPTANIQSEFSTAAVSLLSKVYAFNGIFPIDFGFILIGATLLFWAAVLGWTVLKWGIHLFRGN